MQPADTKKPPQQDENNEVHVDPANAKKLERDLDLGVKVRDENEPVSPGMPAAQGGGLTSEIGATPKEIDPDR